jgi:cell division protein FtsW (lipid II flippase)
MKISLPSVAEIFFEADLAAGISRAAVSRAAYFAAGISQRSYISRSCILFPFSVILSLFHNWNNPCNSIPDK